MLAELEKLNQRLNLELEAPLRVGIGIHSGEAIVGTMGPPSTPIVSAIGDNINIAARLEAETKSRGVPLVISRISVDRAGIPWSVLQQQGVPSHQVSVRGRREALDVLSLGEAQLTEALRQIMV